MLYFFDFNSSPQLLPTHQRPPLNTNTPHHTHTPNSHTTLTHQTHTPHSHTTRTHTSHTTLKQHSIQFNTQLLPIHQRKPTPTTALTPPLTPPHTHNTHTTLKQHSHNTYATLNQHSHTACSHNTHTPTHPLLPILFSNVDGGSTSFQNSEILCRRL